MRRAGRLGHGPVQPGDSYDPAPANRIVIIIIIIQCIMTIFNTVIIIIIQRQTLCHHIQVCRHIICHDTGVVSKRRLLTRCGRFILVLATNHDANTPIPCQP